MKPPQSPSAPTVLVTGGTGTVGRLVVSRLLEAGVSVRVATRHVPGEAAPYGEGLGRAEHVVADLVSGDGVAEAVVGVSTVVHLAGGPRGDDVAGRHLVAAARAAGVSHLLGISIVGVERLPLGFYRTKVAVEREVMESGVPFTLLRAAQFHDLVLTLAQRVAVSPVLTVPSQVWLEPVDARDVADRLVELACGPPAGVVPDLVGPAVISLHDLVRGYLVAAGKRRLLLPLRLPGAVGRAYRTKANLSGGGVRSAASGPSTGTVTWEQFLQERVG